MNPILVNRILFVFWFCVGAGVFGYFYFIGTGELPPENVYHLRMMMYGAFFLAFYNYFRVWIRNRNSPARNHLMERVPTKAMLEYQERIGPLAAKDPPPIVHPDFVFESEKPKSESSS